MKKLYFKETSKGARFLLSIANANIDPLETKAKGVKHAQGLPQFKELEARINSYNDFLMQSAKEGIKFQKPETVPPVKKSELRNRLLVIGKIRGDLYDAAKAHEAESPVYMLAGNSLLVDETTAADIEHVQTEGKVILLRVDKHGKYAGYEVIEDNTGKKYRLPNTAEWFIVNEPDEEMPEGALFDAPDNDEQKVINAIRISNLSDDQRATEKAVHIKNAQDRYSLDVIAADLAATSEAVEIAKTQARTTYDAEAARIENLYN